MTDIILVQFGKLVSDGVFTPIPKTESENLIIEINKNLVKAEKGIKDKMLYTARYYIDQCIDLNDQLEQLYDIEV